MPRKSRPLSVVIRNMMIAERNDAETIPDEQQRGAIELAAAPPEKIYAAIVAAAPRNAAHLHRVSGVRRDNQAQNRAKRRAARNAEHVRIGERIPQQRLKSRARDGERRAHDDSQCDSRQPQARKSPAGSPSESDRCVRAAH